MQSKNEKYNIRDHIKTKYEIGAYKLGVEDTFRAKKNPYKNKKGKLYDIYKQGAMDNHNWEWLMFEDES